MSELLWVAVPGNAGGSPVVRALIVPRLGGAEPSVLAGYGMEDWPAQLAEATLTVEVAPDPSAAPTPVAATRRDDVQPGLWQSFFAADMPVTPWQQRRQGVPEVAPTSVHAGKIVRNYTVSAQAIAEPPPGVDPDGVIRDQYAEWAVDVPAAPEVGPGDPEPWVQPDFHRSVTYLREHPAVLRALGLIVELTLTEDPPASTSAAPLLVRVRCTPGPGLPPDLVMVSAWTAYQFDGGRFLPLATDGSDLRGGMVDLSGAAPVDPSPPPGEPPPEPLARWAVATFDVEGGVGRLRDAAGARGSTFEGPGRASLPALRSAGLMLVRRDRDQAFLARATAATAHAAVPSADQLQLTADDLVLGYRLDVRHLGGDWLPLCRRMARYTVGRVDPVAIGPEEHDEEGHVKAHAATAVGAGDTLRADEVVARWSGWSLAVRRPLFDENGARPVDETRLPMPFHLEWRHRLAAEWILPQLRFGSAYHVRARVADIAGGGLAMDDPASNEGQSELVSYRRHEPVPPPEIPAPVDDLGPGGAVDQLVIRSDPARQLDIVQFAAQHPGYPANDRRTLVPPLGSMGLAEQHGRFDGVDDATTFAWAKRATAPPVATLDGQYSWLPDPAAFGVVMRVRPEPGGPPPGNPIDDQWGSDWPDLPAKSLHLQGRTSDSPTVTWDDSGRRAIVSLRPSEEVTLDVSSHLNPGDVDKHEIRRWLGDASDTAVLAGRHPMVTPARVVRLVHAVRRPLDKPDGRLEAVRAEGDTFAVVHDPDDPLIGVNTASTVQLDVAAAWDEWADGVPTPRTEEVLSVPVGRAVPRLPELRHEFGDTRHRRVTYTLTAVSRFRQFFDPGPDEDFKAANTLAEVRIASSARPVPPRVVSTTPSFQWGGLDVPADWESLGRSRLGGRLRVELARPWHTTGQGEMLAVVVWPGGALPASAAPYVTSVLRDPIWDTPAPAGAAAAVMFSGNAAPPARVRLAEGLHEVLAVPYEVWRDGDRWYADVELPVPAAGSYCPFVRLAVARYQPDSLAGLELSPVVLTELVQLFPDRTLSVARTAGGLQLSLTGTGPAGPRANQVVAAIERCAVEAGVDLTAGNADATMAWRRVAGHSVEGVLGRPLPLLAVPAGEGALRLVVREVERIPADRVAAPGSIGAELEERTVFADVVPLPPA